MISPFVLNLIINFAMSSDRKIRVHTEKKKTDYDEFRTAVNVLEYNFSIKLAHMQMIHDEHIRELNAKHQQLLEMHASLCESVVVLLRRMAPQPTPLYSHWPSALARE